MCKRIRNLVVAEILLGIAIGISTFTLDLYLPPELQEYLANGVYENMDAIVTIAYISAVIFFLVHIISLVGLLLTKIWAKNFYIYSTIGLLLSGFFAGAYVEHAVTSSLDQISILVNGMIIALLVYNSSYTEAAINKASNATP